MERQHLKKSSCLGLVALLLSGSAFGQSNLSVHGYLTQGFGITDKHQIFGIPDDGTFDYRNLALQFRYDVGFQNTLVIQFSHKKLGLSPLMAAADDVELDWGFFQHRFGSGASVKVGRVPLPLGIFNELRDVGVVLPFYRVPATFYREGSFMSETVDGLVVSHVIGKSTPWKLSMDYFVGQWDWLDWAKDPVTGEDRTLSTDVERALGAQFWILTPHEGIRFGVGAHRAHKGVGLSFPEQNFYTYHASVDGDFDRYLVRSEYREIRFSEGIHFTTYYGQLGIKPTEHLQTHVQAEFSKVRNINVPLALGGGQVGFDLERDFALGVNIAFNANLIVKSEIHWSKSFLIEDRVLNVFTEDRVNIVYTLLSLSASF